MDGAFVLKLFGDAATELLIRRDGDEGLFRAYSSVEFLAPVRAGDYLEVEAEITARRTHLARRCGSRRARSSPREASPRLGASRSIRRSSSRARTGPASCRSTGRDSVTRMSDAVVITVAGRRRRGHPRAAAAPAPPPRRGRRGIPPRPRRGSGDRPHPRPPPGRDARPRTSRRFAPTPRRSARACPIIQQFSTGGAVGMGVEERIAALDAQARDGHADARDLQLRRRRLRELAADDPRDPRAHPRSSASTPELEIFDDGMLATADALFAKGLLDAARALRLRPRRARAPPPRPPRTSCTSRASIPAGCTWTVAGHRPAPDRAWRRWRSRWAATCASGSRTTSTTARASSPTRTPGSSSASSRIAREVGREPASVDVARQILRLPAAA